MIVSSWRASQGSFQNDLGEVSLSPADRVLNVFSPPPPANSLTSSSGSYIDDDSIFFNVLESSQPWKFYEARRGSFDTPIKLIEGRYISIAPRFSADKTVFATTHSQDSPADPARYGVLINRAAPGALLRITPAASDFVGTDIIDFVERH